MDKADQLFVLLTKMYSEMQDRFNRIDGEIQEVKVDVKDTKERAINIENDHGKKLTALFDRYKQNSDKLDRIQNEVSKHEEVILRRIK